MLKFVVRYNISSIMFSDKCEMRYWVGGFAFMFSRDIGIDLGTANVLIHIKGKGIVFNEPAVVAMDRRAGNCLEVGEAAERMECRAPRNIEGIRPLKDVVIDDFDVTEAMLKYFIDKIKVKGFFSKPRMLICCPTNITKVEQKAIKEAAEKSGGKKIYLEEEPKVAAIGAGMDIFQPDRKSTRLNSSH